MFKLLFVLVSLHASAFHLGDHARITRQAYAEFTRCFPEYRSIDEGKLVRDDLYEDLNLFRKEIFYSHFYNPEKKIHLNWRLDSMGRIQSLEPGLQQCRNDRAEIDDDEIADLGYAVHHLQDMAVPSHVIPVRHSMWDGFETYDVAVPPSGWTCVQMIAAGQENFEALLNETAERTLQAVRTWRISTGPTVLTGEQFWVESNDDSFGHYGTLGNRFGDTAIAPAAAYNDFKKAQLRLAVRATLRGMVWALRPEATAIASK